jgi:cytochrome c553
MFATLIRAVRAVLWSFVGIRRGAAGRDELEKLPPLALLLVALVLAALFVVTLLGVVSLNAPTQPAGPAVPAPVQRAAQRPLPPQDTLAQRLLACSACHGAEGRATPEGYFPRIAGKPAGYLYQQLLNFRDGRRHNAAMVALMTPLTDAYLREIAAHFAAIDLPYAAPAPTRATPAQLARGELLVRQGDPARQLPACAECHGRGLSGRLPAVPGLAGLAPDYLVSQLGAWRTGLRRAVAPDCMATIAGRLTADDVAAVALWIAAQAPAGKVLPEPRLDAPPSIACSGVQ